MLTEEVIARSLALRELTGKRAEGPFGLPAAGQAGAGRCGGDQNGARRKRETNAGASRFEISFVRDEETGELKLIRKCP